MEPLHDTGDSVGKAHPSPIASVPTEILESVLGWLPARALATAAGVCRRWAAVSAGLPLPVQLALVYDGRASSVANANHVSNSIGGSSGGMQVELAAGSELALLLPHLAGSGLPAVGESAGSYVRSLSLWAVVRIAGESHGSSTSHTSSGPSGHRGSFGPSETFEAPRASPAAVDELIRRAVSTLTRGRRMRVVVARELLLDAARDDGAYQTLASADAAAEDQAAAALAAPPAPAASLAVGFRQALVRHPSPAAVAGLPRSIVHLELQEIHTQVDLAPISTFNSIRSVRLQSDGRFLDGRGVFRVAALRPLSSVADRLSSLNLDGPWFQCMLDYGPSLIEIFKSLVNLHCLSADFDAQIHSPQTLHRLIASLPRLRSFGRLGRVDASFWRLFARDEAAGIHFLSLGNCKYAFSPRLTGNQNFLKDLAFGVLWAFPNIKELTIYLGFQSADTGALLEIVKQLKEGRSLWSNPTAKYGTNDVPTKVSRRSSRRHRSVSPPAPAQQSRQPPVEPSSPTFRALRRIFIFQATDIDNLNFPAWKFAALVHAGGPPISIFISDDVGFNNGLGRRSQRFGPP